MDPRQARVSRSCRASSRLLRRLIRSCLLGLVGAALVAPAMAVGQEGGAGFEIDVDRNEALFELTGLVPGPIGQRCLTVEVRNGTAAAVFVSAEVAGDLAPYLSMTIESGNAVDPSTCAGFSGSSRFSGTLAELGSRFGDPSAGLLLPLTDDRTVVRFTLELADDNTAQGKQVGLTLGFHATDATPPTTTTEPTTTAPEPVTTPTVPAVPTVPSTPTTLAPTTTLASSELPSTTVDEPTTTEREDRPGRTSVATEQGGPATTVGPSSPSTPDVVVVDGGETVSPSLTDQAAEVVKAGVEAAVAAVDVTARTSVVPAAFSGIALAFFLLQSRLERRDPKLADAPVEPEPDLLFEPRLEVPA